MQLLAEQFGTAPPHWLLTAAEELLDSSDQSIDLTQLVEQCRPLLSATDHEAAVQKLGVMQANKAKEDQGDWDSFNAHSFIQLLRPELMQAFAPETDPEHVL